MTANSLMAQQFSNSALDIYNALIADAGFVVLLGTYTFESNDNLPAISIVSAGESLPATRSVSGIECVIQDAGNTVPMNYVSSNADMITDWQLFLIAWEPSNGAQLQVATELVCSKFGGSYSTQTVATSNGIGALVQNKIIISSSNPILA